MKKLVNYTVLALGLSFSSLSAEIDAERLKEAKELAVIMKLEDQMLAGFDAMLPMIEQQAQQLNLDEGEKQELQDIYKDWFKVDVNVGKMADKIVRLYAEEYTAKELRELSDFYKTELGQKTLKILPRITKKSAKIGLDMATAKQHLLLERLTPFLKKAKK